MAEQYIKRSPKGKENPYRMIDRRIMEDDRLSFEARGALAFILVKPDDWKVSVTNLMNEGGIGRDKTYRIINEWIDCGYCERIEHRERGRVVGYEYYIHEEPLTGKPDTAEPDTAEPLPVNKDHTKEEDTTKEETTTKKEERGAAHRTPSDPYFEAVCWMLGRNTKTMTKEGRMEVGKIVKKFKAENYTLDDLRSWWKNVWLKDWRSKRGAGKPTAKQLTDEFVLNTSKDITHVIPDSREHDTLPEYDPQIFDTSNLNW